MFRILFILLSLTGLAQNEAGSVTIQIDSQKSFESIQQTLQKTLMERPDTIVVLFDKGTYYYDDRMIRLDGMCFPETRLLFIGNGATLTAKGEDYSDGDRFHSSLDSGSGIVCGSDDVFPWSSVYFSNGKVKLVDGENHLFQIRCPSLKKNMAQDISYCYILLTEWYKSRMMKVHSIENGSVTFIAEDGEDELNMDFGYARLFPRFKLMNVRTAPFSVQNGTVHIKAGLKSVHICQAGRFISAYGATFKSISFKDFKFIGNRDNVFALMDFTETKTAGITVADCEFCGLHSKLIQVAYTPDFTFSGNCVHDCYRGGINSFASPRTSVTDNVFHNVGLAMSNDFCICCAGEDYRISRNIISDFGYGGIGLGMHYQQKRDCPLTGIVEYNELWYSRSYLELYQEHTLMDSGAIYTWTQNDSVLIRNNYIHDYTGMKDNRGIFMDDGANHITVRDNIILRIANSWSVDSRRVAHIETDPDSQVRQTNIGNVIVNNKTDGKIRFEPRE